MAYYITDIAVFGHVMGSTIALGNEQHHADYEDYVDTRTNTYGDIFNSYLVFDGAFASKTAYELALALAHDTTFGDNGDLTCVWMDSH